ncbi:unnamed protein product, partial [Dibothriocephalus latus]
VAVIAVYSYFICQIIGSQYVKRNGTLTIASHSNALPVPIFGVFYFLFLMGWLKPGFSPFKQVALCVMNPFGDDYEDFECSEILDYNLDVSYRAVLLDESTFPDSLKRATFEAKPMAGAEDDNLQEFLENTTREIQAAYSNEEINEWVYNDALTLVYYFFGDIRHSGNYNGINRARGSIGRILAEQQHVHL